MKQAFLRAVCFHNRHYRAFFGITLTIKGQLFGVGSWDVLHIGLTKQ